MQSRGLHAGSFGELDGSDSDASRCGVYEDALSAMQYSGPVQAFPCRCIVEKDSRALSEAEFVGKYGEVVDADDNLLGVAPVARSRKDAQAQDGWVYALADRFDHSRHLEARHAREGGRIGVEADSGQRIREVDAGGLHRDRHLPLGRARDIRHFQYLEDRRASPFRDLDDAHGSSNLFSGAYFSNGHRGSHDTWE